MTDYANIAARIAAAWNDGEIDRFDEIFHPDVVVIAPEGWPEGEVTNGLEAWKRQSELLRSTWAEAHVEVDEVRGLANHVAARFRYVTVGEGTGLSFETQIAAAFVLEEDKVVFAHYFWKFDEALAKAGLLD